MAMQPKPAVHCVQHSLAPYGELLPLHHQRRGITRRGDRRKRTPKRVAYWQDTNPSAVAGTGGESTLPVNIAQVSGNDCGCVTLADQPEAVAETMVRITPGDVWILSRERLSA
jgi:hypothetical protein